MHSLLFYIINGHDVHLLQMQIYLYKVITTEKTPTSILALWCYKPLLKVKLSLCFNWKPRHEDVVREWRYSFIHYLTSPLDGGEWSASQAGCFTSGTHWIGGRMGARASLEMAVKRKFSSPARTRTRGHPTRSPTLYHWTILAPQASISLYTKKKVVYFLNLKLFLKYYALY
jgi:hypothetical protein